MNLNKLTQSNANINIGLVPLNSIISVSAFKWIYLLAAGAYCIITTTATTTPTITTTATTTGTATATITTTAITTITTGTTTAIITKTTSATDYLTSQTLF
ncbi:hypothetical protein ACTFIZ_011479 [Dictyostelium cf. discoideum]